MVGQDMKIKSILPAFGGKRTLAKRIVEQFGPHSFYYEPFCLSMAVLLQKKPSHHEMVSDLHGGATNLARVIQNEEMAVRLFNKLSLTMFCDDLYDKTKAWLKAFDVPDEEEEMPNEKWAYYYFVASWMGRNGSTGLRRENFQIATRWTKGGGSGALRFRNAVLSIPSWFDRLSNVHVHRRDAKIVLDKIADQEGVVIYADPPYYSKTMTGSSRYLHNFEEEAKNQKGDDGESVEEIDIHQQWFDRFNRFTKARVLVSYYDHPLLSDMYAGWTKVNWKTNKQLRVQNKRGSARSPVIETLFINGPSLVDTEDSDDLLLEDSEGET